MLKLKFYFVVCQSLEVDIRQSCDLSSGSYRGILVMRDLLILFFVKREFRKLFCVTC